MNLNKKKKSVTATDAMHEFIKRYNKQEKVNVLDIGCGIDEPHTEIFKKHDMITYTCDFYDKNDFKGKFTEIEFNTKFDAVWCAHCLEHQENVGAFLRKIHEVTEEDALIAITVPPLKHKIVGGHLSLWNIGLLYYNLIVAGFDCSHAVHKTYGYNLSVILNKKSIEQMPGLFYDNGDIELLAKYFPFKAVQGFPGNELRNTF